MLRFHLPRFGKQIPQTGLCLGVLGLLWLHSLPAMAQNQSESQRDLVLHVLRRVTWGPTPELVESVAAMGVDQFIQEQLEGKKSSPSPELEQRLKSLEHLEMDPAVLAQAQREMRMERRQAEDPESQKAANKKRRQLEREVLQELAWAKLLRATAAENQLEELMVDFWFNHFNVFARKGAAVFLIQEHEQRLRSHAFGRFEDLLIASAQSPAMLFYLDNWLSVDEKSANALRNRQKAPKEKEQRRQRLRREDGEFEPGTQNAAMDRARKRRRQQNRESRERLSREERRFLKKAQGLNENYARELLELHTLGVDGGYTQKDVEAVARCLTGWSVGSPEEGFRFTFRRQLHDERIKTVLGVELQHGGLQDGLDVLQLLARHPSTAHHISTKLARRFLSDDPPEPLIQRMVATWQATDGEIKEVLRTLFFSPEFREPQNFGQKIKTPVEFMVSAFRATGARLEEPKPAVFKALREMGQTPYLCESPTGFPDRAEDWIGSSALLARMSFSARYAASRLSGLEHSRSTRSGKRQTIEDLLELERQLGIQLTDATRDVLESQLQRLGKRPSRKNRNQQPKDPEMEDPLAHLNPSEALLALMLGSPEFQRR